MDLSTSCGFDDLALSDSNPQQRCHSKHQGRRKSIGHQVDETRDNPSTAKPTRPDELISGTSNPIAGKPSRPDESISGTSNPIAAKPTRRVDPRHLKPDRCQADQTRRVDLRHLEPDRCQADQTRRVDLRHLKPDRPTLTLMLFPRPWRFLYGISPAGWGVVGRIAV